MSSPDKYERFSSALRIAGPFPLGLTGFLAWRRLARTACGIGVGAGDRPAGFRDSLETRQNLSSKLNAGGCVNKTRQICKVTVELIRSAGLIGAIPKGQWIGDSPPLHPLPVPVGTPATRSPSSTLACDPLRVVDRGSNDEIPARAHDHGHADAWLLPAHPRELSRCGARPGQVHVVMCFESVWLANYFKGILYA
jgi:hypothetical protein